MDQHEVPTLEITCFLFGMLDWVFLCILGVRGFKSLTLDVLLGQKLDDFTQQLTDCTFPVCTVHEFRETTCLEELGSGLNCDGVIPFGIDDSGKERSIRVDLHNKEAHQVVVGHIPPKAVVGNQKRLSPAVA